MEDASQQRIDRFAPISSPGDRAPELHNLSEKNLAQKDERIVSSNPSSSMGLTVTSRNLKDQPVVSETSGSLITMNPLSSYAPQEQSYYFGGYENGSGHWDEHSNYVGANNLHIIPPAMYNENSSLYYPGYGFDSQMAFGQFSPLASPLSPILIDSQLFSPHQISVPPSYYPPPLSPGPHHASSAHPASQTDMLPSGSSSQENITDAAFFGPGSGYFLPFGNFGGDLSVSSGLGLYKFPGEFGSIESQPSCSTSFDSSRIMSSLTSGTAFPPPFGLLGSYDQTVAQAPFQGFGLPSNSSSRHFSGSGSYHSAVGSNPIRSWITTQKSGKREKDRDSVNNSTDTVGSANDWNRGPRASKPKSKSSGDGSPAEVKDLETTSGFHVQHLNSLDFITDYERAKFFVIKSFSEDNIHKSIKYSVWASTPLGNRKLDTAYAESREMEGICPVFLFFSVNASGQFCGVAEMAGPVNFEKDADYWQQDRWSGQFPVKWHIIKDVPNSRFRHILLENNDNKPVTHSRDSQEVNLDQGIEMLKIFKNHEADTSLLDDFGFYDEREKSLVERKAKQRAGAASVGKAASTVASESIDHLSEKLADALNIDAGRNFSQTESELK